MASYPSFEDANTPLLDLDYIGFSQPDQPENLSLCDKRAGSNPETVIPQFAVSNPDVETAESVNRLVLNEDHEQQETGPRSRKRHDVKLWQRLAYCCQWLPWNLGRDEDNGGTSNDNNGQENGNGNGNGDAVSRTLQKPGTMLCMLDVCRRHSVTCITIITPENNIIQNLVIITYALLLIAAGVMLVVAQHVKALEHHTFRLPYYFISGCMILAILLMSVCLYKKDDETLVQFPDRDDPEGTPVTQYLLKNVYIFGAGNFVLDMVHLAMVVQCFSPGQADDYIASLVFHVFKLIFVFVHVIFLQIFLEHNKVISVGFFKVVISHLTATNFLVWFNFIILETGILDGALHDGHDEHSVLKCNWNGTNITRAIPELANTLSEGLAPFVLEYSLLAMTLLNSMYPHVASTDQEDKEKQPEALVADNHHDSVSTTGENQTADESLVPKDQTVVHRSNLGLMIGLVVVFFVIFPSWLMREYIDYAKHVVFFYGSQSVVMLLNAILSLMIFIEIRKHHKRKTHHRLHADDYLLFGTMGLSFFAFVVALIMTGISSGKIPLHSQHIPIFAIIGLNENLSSIRASLICSALCNLFDVVGQTFMIIEVRGHERAEFPSKKNMSTARIRIYFTILALTNMTMWFTDSFFDMQSSSWHAYYLPYSFWGPTAWLYISRILYPFHIFYRFHAASMIAHILLEFKRD